MKDSNAIIADRLKELRRRRGSPPQYLVAKECGCSHRSLQNWELGNCPPQWTNAVNLAKYYNVTPEYILGREPHRDDLAAIFATLHEILATLDELRQTH